MDVSMTPDEIRRQMETDAIRIACQVVLGEDATGLTQRHFDDLRTLIQAYLWSEESDRIVQEAAKRINTEHFLSQNDYNGEPDAVDVDTTGA